jgi:hypothetical protein
MREKRKEYATHNLGLVFASWLRHIRLHSRPFGNQRNLPANLLVDSQDRGSGSRRVPIKTFRPYKFEPALGVDRKMRTPDNYAG